jgi:hypothetical protein
MSRGVIETKACNNLIEERRSKPIACCAPFLPEQSHCAQRRSRSLAACISATVDNLIAISMAQLMRSASPRSPPHGLLAACAQGNHKSALNALRIYRDLLDDKRDNSGPERTRVTLSLHETDSSGLPPLLHAVKHGWADVLKELIALGANVNAKTRNNGNTALHLAALHKHLEVARELCSHTSLHSPDVDARNSNGDTPLMFACGMGCLGVASLLLQVGRG